MIKTLRNCMTMMKESAMADLGCGCGKMERHPFHGLIRGMDGTLYYVHCKPPLQSLHGECEACDWHLMHRVIPAHCPRCGRPTRVVSLDDTSAGTFPHEGMAARGRVAWHSGR
jgi:hypothetical protein